MRLIGAVAVVDAMTGLALRFGKHSSNRRSAQVQQVHVAVQHGLDYE